ncbi:MerR family transcriptional regulator [Alloscardovia theropitheci]|uniref:MerR family transcriptional regulator n=1 Tax=Alloscardovia theropitheci TaxID=2496842 RepID=A0A4R0QVM7_9BIFI|nr:MerR family transcriptional regulator [Alloscardovia theropitheci]TCD54287.1 MerR family transcriptional regulator [Alloscardovia theropitheci]
MLKISEFAKLAHTTRRTLLFYDEKGIFSPSIIEDNGYRYYDADQIYQFEIISGLRQLGLSLQEIQQLLNSSPHEYDSYMKIYQTKIQDEIKRLKLLNELLTLKSTTAEHDTDLSTEEVTEIYCDKQEYWCTDLKVDCTPDEIARIYTQFMDNLGEFIHQIPSQSGFITHLSLSHYTKYMTSEFRFIKETVPFEPHNVVTKIEKPAGRYIAIKVHTSEKGIMDGLEKLTNFSKEHQLLTHNYLRQLNAQNTLISNGSSRDQILMYQIKEK